MIPRFKKFVFATLILSVVSVSFSCNSPKNKNIAISGAFALYPLGVKWGEAFKKIDSSVNFDISAGGAGKGLTDVLAGAADLAMFSRELTDEEKKKDIWVFAVAKDAVLPTFNPKNPSAALIKQKGLTQAQFERVFFVQKPITWDSLVGGGSQKNVAVYTRSDAAGAADTWAAYFHKKQENIKGIGIYSDPGLADAVAKDDNGIGFNNLAFVYDISSGKIRQNIDVLPIDINGNRVIDTSEQFYGNLDTLLHAIADGRYPSPPARELYFITKGKPTNPKIIAFLKWVLTDGQDFVKKAGYVPLPDQIIKEQLAKLN